MKGKISEECEMSIGNDEVRLSSSEELLFGRRGRAIGRREVEWKQVGGRMEELNPPIGPTDSGARPEDRSAATAGRTGYRAGGGRRLRPREATGFHAVVGAAPLRFGRSRAEAKSPEGEGGRLFTERRARRLVVGRRFLSFQQPRPRGVGACAVTNAYEIGAPRRRRAVDAGSSARRFSSASSTR